MQAVDLFSIGQQVGSYKMKNYIYELIETGLGQTIILRSDGACIPTDPANSDYQRYLNPEAEQSTPMIPGDE
jgi:hypothetical protein